MNVVSKATNILGQNIRKLRRQRGWSQEELADRLDTAQSLISQIERGAIDTSFAKVIQIARALEVGLPELTKDCYEGPRRNRAK